MGYEQMTNIEAMKLALDALDDLYEGVTTAIKAGDWVLDGACDPTAALCRTAPAIAALRQTISEAEHAEQEPVGWLFDDVFYEVQQCEFGTDIPLPNQTPLYTAPPVSLSSKDETRVCVSCGNQTPQLEWVGLSEEDLIVCDEDGVTLARYWEAKLKEKNCEQRS